MKDEHGTVGLALDLRQALWAPASADDYEDFWRRNVGQLFDLALKLNQKMELRDRQVGNFTLSVTLLPTNFQRVTTSTPFIIQSVLERPRVNFVCGCCGPEASLLRHASLSCSTCSALERAGNQSSSTQPGATPKICAAHAVILEGSLRAFCPAHTPRCACSDVATGFCFGPSCRKRDGVAFCGAHLRAHPNVASVYFCNTCYEELFPRCSFSGCPAVATIRCSHWQSDAHRACNRTYCAEHANRWRVYGLGRAGLARCEEHSDLERFSNEGLIFQLAASALVEQRHLLPTLQAVTHILMKPRGHRYAIAEVKRLFDDVRGQLDPSDPFQREMIALVDAHELARQEQLQRDEDEKRQGKPFYDALIAELRRRQMHELADNIQYADFRPSAHCLFIRLAERFRGRLIGVGGEVIQDLSRTIGVRIQFERGSR